MDHIDWYFSTSSNDLVLPSDEEALVPSIDDRSLDDLFQWEVDAFNRRISSVKYGLEPLVHKGEDCDLYSSYEQISVADSSPTRTSNSSPGHWFLGNRPDYQLQNSTERNDDIFMNSLLELDSPESKTPYELSNISLDSTNRSTSSENLLEDMLVDTQNDMKGTTCMGSSKYIKTWGSMSADDDAAESEDKLEDSGSCFIADDSRSEGSPTDPMLNVVSPSEGNAPSETITLGCRKKILGTTVLQDLEDVVTQLNRKTRICFRDALYRLAKSSKEQHTLNQNRRLNFVRYETTDGEVTGENLSHKQPQSEESKSNSIDRTIANLMFNRLNCDPMDLPAAALTQENMEDNTELGSYNYNLKQPLVSPHSYGPTSLCDISFPFFDKEESNSSKLLYKFSSAEPAVTTREISHMSSC